MNSAVTMGLRLWGRSLAGAATIAGGVAVVVTVAALVVFGGGWAAAGFGLGVGVVVMLPLGRVPSGARRWIQGGLAELRTARNLAVARRSGLLRGWWFAHDLSIPKSRANLDHVAVHPSGRVVVYLDTKAWHAKGAVVRVSGSKLMYGPWDQTKALETVEWEASRVRAVVGPGVRVVPMIVCDRTRVDGGVIDLDGALIVASDQLTRTLRAVSDAGRDKSLARRTRRGVAQAFPRK